MHQDYPEYEVILVDDGSSDETPEIAKEFPQVLYHRQENRGLSEARNIGASLATGEIIAYTDSDCVASKRWLLHLVRAMQDQQVEAMGGPNLSPDSDGWIAKCVDVSPGNPAHVMLDDRYAEHIPGCNIAFCTDVLLGLGGFDPRFHQAGDDVDICWRLLDADLRIGYSSRAFVWHHRRNTVSAYLKQQKGYGTSEAMLRFKHPQAFSRFGGTGWKGIIYGDKSTGSALARQTIYHGPFGSAPYQHIYRQNHYSGWHLTLALQWHLVAGFALALGSLFWPLAVVSVLMWCATLGVAFHIGWKTPLPRDAPVWCRPLVIYLNIVQPLVRGAYRLMHVPRRKKIPQEVVDNHGPPLPVKWAANCCYLCWQSDNNIGRELLLEMVIREAKRHEWQGDFNNGWADWDLKLFGDRWHDVTIHTATEELGGSNRLTRARCTVRTTSSSNAVTFATVAWIIASLASVQIWAMGLAVVATAWLITCLHLSRRRCLRSTASLVSNAGQAATLTPVDVSGSAWSAAMLEVNITGPRRERLELETLGQYTTSGLNP